MKSELHGCIYLNKKRYWWKVQLPGESEPKARPLRPEGSKWATKDKGVAEEVARLLWERALLSPSLHHNKPRTITDMVTLYLAWANNYYAPPSNERTNIAYGLRPLVELYGNTPPEEFGPLKLKKVRQAMVEKGWSRGVVNKRVGMIKRMFGWAVGEEYVYSAVYAALQSVWGLRRGRTNARETEPIKPVEPRHIAAILPHTSKVIKNMLLVQLYTGMRSGELCQMRPCDIETGGKVWFYRPQQHKTAYQGASRIVVIGPKAQTILQPYLDRRLDDFCFKPMESETARGVRHTNVTYERYSAHTYRQAVCYAIQAARKAGIEVPDFHPHQIRHTAATRIRKERGLEASKAALGHKSIQITEIYAQADLGLAIDAALVSG